MSNYIVDGSDLTSIANAIRAKGGTSGQLQFPGGFVDAIDAIETGGGGYDIGAWIDKSLSGEISIDTQHIGAYAIYNMTSLTGIKAKNVTSIGTYGVYGNSSLTVLCFPKLEYSDANGMRQNVNLTAVDILGGRASSVTLGNNQFNNCAKLNVIVIRASRLSAISSTNVITGTPFASNGTGGTLYVPQAQIASFQSAANWSTILGYANNSIQAIEGSIYETQYADGTPIE